MQYASDTRHLFERARRPVRSRRTLIRGARQLLTLHGPTGPRRGRALADVGLIEDGALLISGGVDSHAGSARRIENLAEARAADELNVQGRVVIPGLVDSHALLVSAFREKGAAATETFPADLESGEALVIQKTPPRLLEAATRQQLMRLIRQGASSVESRCGYELDEAGEIRIIRLLTQLDGKPARVITSFRCGDFSGRGGNGRSYQDWVSQFLLPKLKQRTAIRFLDIQCGWSDGDSELARVYLTAAAKLGFRVKINAGRRDPSAAVRLAAASGAVSIDSLTPLASEEIRLLAESGAIATLLPLRAPWASAIASARQWIDAGVAVSLASGYHCLASPESSMLGVISAACNRMGMTAAEAISAATINAAHACGEAARSGSLEHGKAADLVVLDLPDYRELPLHLGPDLVHMTILNGDVVYRQAEVLCPEPS